MLRFLQALNTALGSLLALLFLAVLAGGGGWAWYTYNAHQSELRIAQRDLSDKQRTIDEMTANLAERGEQLATAHREIERQAQSIRDLQDEVFAQKKEIQRLDTAVRLLKVDHRVARVHVVRQAGSADEGNLTTTFTFAELGGDGQPLEEPREFTIAGDVIYVDAWVIKFDDTKIENADPLGSTSVCLFRRVFGETQTPAEGFPLDPVGLRPAAYRATGPVSDVEREIWARFWEYANDPELARKSGVRAAHGEAPSMKLVLGHNYRVLLRASGGLTIVDEGADETREDDAAKNAG